MTEKKAGRPATLTLATMQEATRKGLTPKQVHEEAGVSLSAVYGAMHRWKAEGVKLEKPDINAERLKRAIEFSIFVQQQGDEKVDQRIIASRHNVALLEVEEIVADLRQRGLVINTVPAGLTRGELGVINEGDL